MSAGEQLAVGAFFADDAPGLLVSYTRREFDVVELADGSRTLVEVGSTVQSPSGALSIPSMATAATGYGSKPGTDLTFSISVIKTRSSSPYEWQVYPYAQWSGYDGMDCCNNYEDSFGVAWNGGLYIHSDAPTGRYYSWCVGEPYLDIYRSDAAANLGLGYSFHEWWDPDNCPMYWAGVDIRIRETSWKYTTSNVTMKYFHTWGNYNYSLGFSASGPSVTISPTTSTWSAAAYTSFSH